MESKPFKSVDDQIVILREREWKSVITNLLAEFFVKLDTIDCLDTPIPIVLFKRRRGFAPITWRCQWVVAMSSLNASVGVR